MREIVRSAILHILGFFSTPKPGVHILNAHYVTPKTVQSGDNVIFLNFINQIRKKAKLLRIEEAVELLEMGEIIKNETLVAFTYDDGYAECYDVIAPALEKFGCNAAFFINGNYIDSEPSYQVEFNKRVILDTKKPMSWQQVVDLHKRGHIIGSHTLDHFNIAKLNPDELLRQIIENKESLERKLHYKCDYFAWPYGHFEHINQHAFELISKNHSRIFSGTNHRKYFSFGKSVINRRLIESFWPNSHVNYFLSFKKNY